MPTTKKAVRSLITLAAIAFALILVSAPARAADYSVYGSYLDTDGLNDAPGLGFRVAFFKKIQLQISGTYYDSFEADLFEGTQNIVPLGGPIVFPIDLIPLDVGGAYYFDEDATGFYLGGGMSWLLLDSDVGNTDNELGFYAQAGYQMPKGFFAEVLYRNGDGKVDDVPVVGPERFTSLKYDVNGIAINLGWRF